MSESASESSDKFSSAYYSGAGILYFLAAGQPKPVAVKIGVTKRDGMLRRLRGIQSANHEPISLLGVILFTDGEKPLLAAERKERELHRRFSHLQRMVDWNVGYEWFDATSELLAFVDEVATPPEALGLPRSVAKLRDRGA